MTQLVELPPADAGLAPIFGYVLEGRIFFELEGKSHAKSLRVRRSGNLAPTSCTTRLRV
jgi:hypothetical protein